MRTPPRISIVTPCFNHESLVADTIRSVQAQSYPSLEYIVIDDGSTDNSLEVIKEVANPATKIYSLSGHRDSPNEAINFGFSMASGDILAWLSSDDLLLPGAAQTVAEIFTEWPDVHWISGRATTVDHAGQIRNSRLRTKHKYDFLAGDWAVIQQESTFFSRELWEEAGGAIDLRYTQAFDTELWTRFFAKRKLYFVDVPLGAFRKGPQSRSTRNKAEFLSWNHKALEEMWRGSLRIDRLRGLVWRALKTQLGRFLLLGIPARLYRIVLRPFLYPVFRFSFDETRWVLENRR